MLVIMGESMLLVVSTAIIVVALTAYLSLLEASVLGVDDLKLVTLLRKKTANKKHIKAIFKKKREYLSALVLLGTLTSIAGSSFIGAIAAKQFNSIGLAIFTALLTYFMLVFAKMLPKTLAVQMADKIIIRRAPLICLIQKLVKPFLGLTSFWFKALPIKITSDSPSSEDLRSIIRHYNKKGVIHGDQRKLAENAIKIVPQTLSDLLKDWESSICLPEDTTIAAIEPILKKHAYKRYVVTSENGNPVGIVQYRHLARALVNGKTDTTVKKLMRQTICLPPETTLVEAIFEFQEARASVALLPGTSPDRVRFVTAKKVYHALLHGSNTA